MSTAILAAHPTIKQGNVITITIKNTPSGVHGVPATVIQFPMPGVCPECQRPADTNNLESCALGHEFCGVNLGNGEYCGCQCNRTLAMVRKIVTEVLEDRERAASFNAGDRRILKPRKPAAAKRAKKEKHKHKPPRAVCSSTRRGPNHKNAPGRGVQHAANLGVCKLLPEPHAGWFQRFLR
jgi:hypothetical protein